MYIFVRYFYIFLLITVYTLKSYALSLENKYPSYAYIFSEFDIDESYLYNDDFISFVKKNEKHLKDFYLSSLERGETLLPMMQGKLIEDGVSDLFIYLSMIESGFSTDIVSSKKAVGLWQFMPATAKDYDLVVCQNYDERCDAKSATSAAIKHLNRLHKRFGKWYVAAMAYNCGEGCVDKAIKRAGTDDIGILTDNSLKYLPKETRDYLKKILLVAMIGESRFVGLDSIVASKNNLIEVEIEGSSSLADVAKLINMDIKKLMKINSQIGKLQKNIFYKITIPLEKIYAFYLRYELPIAEKIDKSHMITHVVVLGDTLDTLAKQYETNVDEIRVANHLEYPFLTVNMLLVIPVSQRIFDEVVQ